MIASVLIFKISFSLVFIPVALFATNSHVILLLQTLKKALGYSTACNNFITDSPLTYCSFLKVTGN